MIDLDDALASDFLLECSEHLDKMEAELLAAERAGATISGDSINSLFRAVHSIKGGAGFFDLLKVRELAHQTEDLLALIRSGKLAATSERIRVLLRATDVLRNLLENASASNQANIADISAALTESHSDQPQSLGDTGTAAAAGSRIGAKPLRVLLVEDDFTSRFLLQTFLARFGECHVAVNGREAVDGFRYCLLRGEAYDLICMDIMMPEMNGVDAIRQIRDLEEEVGYTSTTGAKIIMTTAVTDPGEIFRCFRELCDGYLIKPIDLGALLRQMKELRLVP